jgi:hypothetical protein
MSKVNNSRKNPKRPFKSKPALSILWHGLFIFVFTKPKINGSKLIFTHVKPIFMDSILVFRVYKLIFNECKLIFCIYKPDLYCLNMSLLFTDLGLFMLKTDIYLRKKA